MRVLATSNRKPLLRLQLSGQNPLRGSTRLSCLSALYSRKGLAKASQVDCPARFHTRLGVSLGVRIR
jgi:hypothetical protein